MKCKENKKPRDCNIECGYCANLIAGQDNKEYICTKTECKYYQKGFMHNNCRKYPDTRMCEE